LAGARSQERAQASNAVAQAKAALDQAQSDAQRMRALLQMGAIARQQLDAAETQFRVAQAAYNTALQQQSLVIEGPRTEDIQAARAQLAQAEALLASTLIQMRDATVTAPFAGTIVRRAVEPGESVSPLAPSFVLAQLDDVYIELLVPERHRAALRAGQRADVRVDALPGRQFTGKVAEISPAASAVSRSFVVKVRVANPDRVLQPGMFARATIVTGTRSGVLQIPERAVLATAGGPVIFIVQGGRAVRRAVTLGDRQGGLLEIRSGVSAGESVVVGGQEGLTDNQAVAPRPPQP
jgi:RND family efflux transporter MFP subunit